MATRCATRGCSQLGASTSAARAFVQLTPPRHLHTAPLPVLDFLLPNISPCIGRNGSPVRQRPRSLKDAKRSFVSSSRRRQTSAIFNPRQDEDGNDMSVEITPRASNVNLTSTCVYVKIADTMNLAPQRDHVSRFKSEPSSTNTS